MKTSELQGAALDWAVAKCEGLVEEDHVVVDNLYGPQWRGPEYSVDWAQGGPIIERERITLVAMPDGTWQSQGRNLRPHFHNPTPLIAAMRCFVASRLGDTVNIPEELV